MHLAYLDDLGARRHLRIYPTLQFLYSHHVRPEYVTPQVRAAAYPPPLCAPRCLPCCAHVRWLLSPQVRELLTSFKELGDPTEHCRLYIYVRGRRRG